MKATHQYHLVEPSPLPLVTSMSLFTMVIGAVLLMHDHFSGKIILPFGVVLLLSSLYTWWSDVVKEARIDNAHTKIVRRGLSFGMILFIASEVMFFFAFFWSFFHARFFPHEMVAGEVWSVHESIWPPKGIEKIDAWNLPFINTLILLLSGTTVNWANQCIKNYNKQDALLALRITIFLGVAFTLLQAYEYVHVTFTLSDGVYPANFFMATGFHGFHVIIGTIFLTISYFRTEKGHFDQGNNILGFTFAEWYWHFVDVVWLFLFIFVNCY